MKSFSWSIFKNDDVLDPFIKNESIYRWLILYLICLISLGHSYVYDMPAALKSQLYQYVGIDSYEINFNLLYTLYACHNIILPYYFSHVMNKHNLSLLLFYAVINTAISQVLFTISIFYNQWWLTLISRFVVMVDPPDTTLDPF